MRMHIPILIPSSIIHFFATQGLYCSDTKESDYGLRGYSVYTAIIRIHMQGLGCGETFQEELKSCGYFSVHEFGYLYRTACLNTMPSFMERCDCQEEGSFYVEHSIRFGYGVFDAKSAKYDTIYRK